jgi:hypothetical protein
MTPPCWIIAETKEKEDNGDDEEEALVEGPLAEGKPMGLLKLGAMFAQV